MRLVPLRVAILLLGTLLASPLAAAESVLDRIARTGVLTAGTRADAFPFGFQVPNGPLQGFSVDLLGAIRTRLAAELGRPIELELVAVAAADRIPMVADGRIDIECGITTPTWSREAQVDFSLPFFENGTRILTFRGASQSLDDLRDARIAVVANSTTYGIVERALPDAELVEVGSMNDGLRLLLDGKIDGLANIGIALRGLIEPLDNKSRFVMLPRADSLSYETMACVLPQNDSRWRDFVNRTLVELLRGIGSYRGGYYDIYERWFGLQGALFFPLDRSIAERLEAARMWLD